MDTKIQVEIIWDRETWDPPEFDKHNRKWGTLFIRPLLKQSWGWQHLNSSMIHGYMEIQSEKNHIHIFDREGWSTAIIDCDEIIN